MKVTPVYRNITAVEHAYADLRRERTTTNAFHLIIEMSKHSGPDKSSPACLWAMIEAATTVSISVKIAVLIGRLFAGVWKLPNYENSADPFEQFCYRLNRWLWSHRDDDGQFIKDFTSDNQTYLGMFVTEPDLAQFFGLEAAE